MALQAAYTQFLAAPNTGALAADASLNYITTTISFHGATDIITHLSKLRNQIKKRKEGVLSAVEGPSGLAVEMELSLEFLGPGAAYLPGMDDNFLADHTVTLPIIHLVAFDADGKIAQIRQSWDQGSLLKQLNVIGKTGHNWPIRDGADQLRLITQSISKTGKADSAPAAAAAATAATAANATKTAAHSRASSTHVTRDPYATLGLSNPNDADNAPAPPMSPYAGSRPAQRSFTDILGDDPAEEEEQDDATSPSRRRGRSTSPRKAVAPKMGAGKNFGPSRLFEAPEERPGEAAAAAVDTSRAVAPKGAGKNYGPSRLFDTGDDKAGSEPDAAEGIASAKRASYMPHPKKYQHFDFADGSDPRDAPQPGLALDETPRSKHNSNWSFDDFVTPQKPQASKSPRQQQDRHWGNEDDEVEESPERKPVQPKPRRDAQAHFDLQDDGLPSGEHPARPRGATHNNGLGLYQEDFFTEEGSGAPEPGQDGGPRALGNITNLKDRRKDFDAHFAMTDDSPRHGASSSSQAAAAAVNISEDRAKAVKMMEANWAPSDESPASQKENSEPVGGGVGGPRTRAEAPQRIAIAGDGMGGRKGSHRGWGIGDDSDEEQPAPVPPKKQQAPQKAGSSFSWDF